jgi:predicted hydrolase (HD superfamily)
MNREDAIKLIQFTSRYDHSVLVSKIMVILAEHHHEHIHDWELVGLLHDLDYDETAGNREMHGILAAKSLDGLVNPSVLKAIRYHDHRTGDDPTTLLDHSLKFSDAVSIIVKESDSVLADKPWLNKIIESYELQEGLIVEEIIKQVSC